MPVIKLPVGAPFAQAVVNTAHVYCTAPDPEDTAKSRLFIHALGERFSASICPSASWRRFWVTTS